MNASKWFKPKRYGYGNVPSSWQGWGITIAFVLFVVSVSLLAERGAISDLAAVGIVLAITAPFIWFVRGRTDGEWRWRWGERD